MDNQNICDAKVGAFGAIDNVLQNIDSEVLKIKRFPDLWYFIGLIEVISEKQKSGELSIDESMDEQRKLIDKFFVKEELLWKFKGGHQVNENNNRLWNLEGYSGNASTETWKGVWFHIANKVCIAWRYSKWNTTTVKELIR